MFPALPKVNVVLRRVRLLQGIDGQHPRVGPFVSGLFPSLLGNTDVPLLKGRVPPEAHLITLNLVSKSYAHVKGKCSVINL